MATHAIQMFISQLSESEAARQSQSSVHSSDTDDSMSDSDEASTSNDEVDEFGFPYPSASTFPSSAEAPPDAPLVLMENWDGQFVLVQPRQERSRSRRRGSRGSRTAGSIGESTVLSAFDQQGLIIDPDAAEHEFDEDTDRSSWSGVSDEEDGDTTDSMEEDDMPLLDSPALQGLIEQQMADITMGIAVKGSSALQQDVYPNGPMITITDIALPETPLSDGTLEAQSAVPATPHPPAPLMGTFHPATDDPAQHAVIDGSKTVTKSPFTHRRRSRRISLVSSGHDRKRKSSIIDPFASGIPATSTLPKRARYSSIPGHPRYVAARQSSHAMGLDRETTPSECESGAIDLEDMLETSVLMHDYEQESNSHFRFDRVPVSTYLQRNFLSSGGGGRGGGRKRDEEVLQVHHAYSSRMSGMRGGSLTETLAGPPGRMLISPMLEPVVEGEEGMLSRRDRRRARRNGPAMGMGMVQLQI